MRTLTKNQQLLIAELSTRPTVAIECGHYTSRTWNIVRYGERRKMYTANRLIGAGIIKEVSRTVILGG